MDRKVFFVGTDSEVAHQAAPLFQSGAFETEIIAPEQVVEAAKPGNVAVYYSEHFDRFRQSITELRKKQVATVYLVDGILEWRNAWDNSDTEPACPFTMRPALCDKVATISVAQARTLRDWGNAGRIEVIGIPRLDQQVEHWKNASSKKTTNREKPFRVVVSTAKTPGFTTQQLDITAQSLTELKNFFDDTKRINGRSIEVVWRLTADLDRQIGVENSLTDLTGTDLATCLHGCDAMITTPSTAMLEGMLNRIPVALLNYHHCPDYVPSAWSIRSRDSIATTVCQLESPSPSRMQFQNSLLTDNLQVAVPATKRLVQLIDSIFADAEPQLADANSLEFSANLLPTPVLVSELGESFCKLELRDVFANFNEFTDDIDTDQLKTQLAHSRREIEHLKRVEAGLRSELAEAHSIFETIHQHPIAGPIVRIRERFIQFMKRNKEQS